jgi:hypothetical protein
MYSPTTHESNILNVVCLKERKKKGKKTSSTTHAVRFLNGFRLTERKVGGSESGDA